MRPPSRVSSVPDHVSFWDQQYSVAGFKYGTEPNAFLRARTGRLRQGGMVLVPGDGEGRNGVWLATQGFQVTSVDSSAVGLAKARALAAEHGVTIDTVLADLTEWSPAPESVDAVVLTYVHFPDGVRRGVHQRLFAAVRSGGILLLEAFHPSHLGTSAFGPKDAAMLYTLEMLRGDLAAVPGPGFEELEASEETVELDEGPGHAGPGRVVRLIARRRADEAPI